MCWKPVLLGALSLLFLTSGAGAQTLVDDARSPLTLGDRENTFAETIKIISASKKIFVITNNNQQLGVGDFISLALDNSLAARAIVAKTHEGQAGIKIIKIYSLSQWNRLKKGSDVLVIRGDDSSFGKKTETKVEITEQAPKIRSEEDLFNSTVVDDAGELEDNSRRHIKPDNVVGAGLGFVDEQDLEGGGQRAAQFSFSWAYQFTDNWFAEFNYSRAQFEDFPSQGAQTLVNVVTGRLKYNFKGPLYTFFMPYVGFYSQTVDSNAGETNNAVLAQRELNRIEELKKTGPVFGITVLRRLVPGWFLKADLGTDVMNAGVAIEF